MSTRTTQTIVHFSSAFLLPAFEALQPAGDYRVDHDEEAIDGVSYTAWRRTGTFIHLPAIGVQGPMHQMIPIDPADLEAARRWDISQPQAAPRPVSGPATARMP